MSAVSPCRLVHGLSKSLSRFKIHKVRLKDATENWFLKNSCRICVKLLQFSVYKARWTTSNKRHSRPIIFRAEKIRTASNGHCNSL